MFITTLTLAICLALVSSRDIVKPKPTTNSLSHSILNLGKMEINVYLNEKHFDRKKLEDIGFKQDRQYRHDSPKSEYEMVHPSRSQTDLRIDPIIEACPCAGHSPGRSRDSFPQSPTDILSKILMSNNLFNRDPLSSSLCCSSHEQVQEEFFIEFSPKKSPSQMHLQSTQRERTPTPPELFYSRKPGLVYQPFPNRPGPYKALAVMQGLPDMSMIKLPNLETDIFEKKKPNRPDIQVVGDKKTTMLIDLSPTKLSVKKDLTKDKVGTSLGTTGEFVNTTNSVSNSNNL